MSVILKFTHSGCSNENKLLARSLGANSRSEGLSSDAHSYLLAQQLPHRIAELTRADGAVSVGVKLEAQKKEALSVRLYTLFRGQETDRRGSHLSERVF